MWKAAVGSNVKVATGNSNDDEWETDPDFVNNVSEEEQRWGGKAREAGAIDMNALLEQTRKEDAELKKKALSESQQSSYGYGGKFGVQTDRMDRSAVGHEHIEKVEKHASQKDYAVGFGGKYGVQKDRMDKSAVGHEYVEKVEKHASQKDYAVGFGGKYGLQKDRMDKSAVGHDYVAQVDKHASQKDYAIGFGGKFGVQADRVDKSAHGWDYQEKPQKHESQTDYAKGFGGKFGVQTDRQDSSAKGFDDEQGPVGTTYEKVKPVVAERGKASALKSRFESMAEENKKSAQVAPIQRNPQSKVAKFASQLNAPQPKTEPAVPKPPPTVEKTALTEAVPPSVKTASPEPVPPSVKTASPEPVPEPEPISIPDRVSAPEPPKTAPPVLPIPAAFEDQSEPSNEADDNEWDDQDEDQHHYTNQHVGGYDVTSGPTNEYSSVNEPIYEENEELDEQAEVATYKTGFTAVAVYDYQAAAEDEISFDPDDIITNIEMIDEGWWRGECRGQIGLFPANYVQLQE